MTRCLRAGLVLFLTLMVCGGAFIDSVTECGAQSPPGGPAVSNVKVDPPVPRVGDKIKLSFDLEGDAIRAEVRWKLNGEEVLLSDYMGEPIEFDQPVKTGDTLIAAITPFNASGDAGTIVQRRFVLRKGLPEIKLLNEMIRGELYTAKVDAKDPEGAKVSIALEEAPPGMTMDPEGNIQWKVEKGTSGRFPVKISAEDSQGQKTYLTYEVGVRWQ